MKEKKQEPSLKQQTKVEKSLFSNIKDALQQPPSVTANTLHNAQIGDYATVEVHTNIYGAPVNIGENAAEQKAAFEKRVQEHLQQMADRLKQYYSTKGTITTLIQKLELQIADIMLAITDYESKPYQARVLEEQKVSSGGGDRKDEPRVQAQQSTEILKYYESLHNPTRLIPAAQMFDAKIPLPEKEKKQEGAEEKESRKNEGPIKPIKRLLVLGVAGTGKTTMSQYFAHQWATKQLWQEKFDYVFWLPLRNLTEMSKQENHSLAVVVYRECLQTIVKDPKEAEAVIQAIQVLFKTQSSRILLVLDGYDEVGHLMSDATHPVTKVLQEAFTTEHFIVTSRPYHLYQMVPFDRRLENTGFTDDNIHQYIQQYFAQSEKEAKGKEVKGAATGSSQKLQAFLRSNPALWGMAHIPINLTLICDVWQQLQDTDVAKEQLTTTQLYQIILDHLLRVYLKKKGKSEGDLYNATSEELQTHCVVELAFLQKIAIEAMQQGRVNLTPHLQQEIANEVSKEHAQTIRSLKSKPVFEAVLEMGLLRTVQASPGREIQKEHCFLHLTFQEYLAACYLKESLVLSPQTKRYQQAVRFITEEKYNPRYQVLFGFLAGSVNRSEDARVIFWNTILASPLDLTSSAHWRLVVRCLEEANCEAHIPHRNAVFHSFADWTAKLLNNEEAINKWLIEGLQLPRYPVFCEKSGLIEILRNVLDDSCKHLYVKISVAEMLENLGAKVATAPAIEALLKALGDSDGYVRYWAVSALGDVGEKVATAPVIKALVKALGDRSSGVGRAAAFSLGKLGEKGATAPVIEALLKALGDRSSGIGRAAAFSLGKLGEKGATAPVIEALLKALGESEVRYAAASALKKLGEKGATAPVIKVFVKALGDSNSKVRGHAASALGKLGEKGATAPVIEALVKALGDSKWEDRDTAACALVKLGESGAVIEALLKALGDSGSGVSCDAAEMLGALGDKGTTAPVIDALLKALGDSNRDVRGSAAFALGKLGEKGATAPVIDALVKALVDSDSKVRSAAAYALGALGEKGATAPVIEVLVKELGDSNSDARGYAAFVIGKLGEKGATAPVIKALLKALSDSNTDVRGSAAFALKFLGEEDAKGLVVEALLKELNISNKNNRVRSEVIEILKMLWLFNEKVPITRINAERLLLTALKIMDLEDDNKDIKGFLTKTSFCLCPLMDAYHKRPHPFLLHLIACNTVRQDVPFMLVAKNTQHSVNGYAIFYENGKRYEYEMTIAQQKELATAFISVLEEQDLSPFIPQAYLSGKPVFSPVAIVRGTDKPSAPASDYKDGTTAVNVVNAGSFTPPKNPIIAEIAARISTKTKLKILRSSELKDVWNQQDAKEREKILASVKGQLLAIFTSEEGKGWLDKLSEADFNDQLADAIAERIVDNIADISSIEIEPYQIKDGIQAYKSKMQSLQLSRQPIAQLRT